LVRRCEGSSDARGFKTRVGQRVLGRHVIDQRRAEGQRLVERHNRRLGSDLDRDPFGEILGLGGGGGDRRGDRLADIGDALMREDRLRDRDIIGDRGADRSV
jgi:hypothetical protein